MATIGLVLFFAILVVVQVRDMIKKALWRELIAYSILMTVAMILSFGLLFDLKLLNPIAAVEKVFNPVIRYLDALMI